MPEPNGSLTDAFSFLHGWQIIIESLVPKQRSSGCVSHAAEGMREKRKKSYFWHEDADAPLSCIRVTEAVLEIFLLTVER
jgi:hypothetical protein